MTEITRRDALKGSVAAATAMAAGTNLLVETADCAEATWANTPESGAQIRVLRWKHFIKSESDRFAELTKRFTDSTGIKVRLDAESWEDIRPKAAVAANVGAGPDIIIGTNDDPHKFPDKLVRLNDLADYLGSKYGGWYDVCRQYGMHGNDWIALPQGVGGSCINYRISALHKAGFDAIPTDFDGFLKLCQRLKANGTPPGFALGHATGDANNWTHWCLWSHGGKVVDSNSKVVLDSPETVAALEYAKLLADTFVPGTLSWQDPNNNKAFLSGDISLTGNGISIYTVAKSSNDQALLEIAKDMDHAQYPIGPIGHPTEQNLMLTAFVFKYSKYPNAAKEYLRYMWDEEQYASWETASNGYISQPLQAYRQNPIWTADPKNTPFRDVASRSLVNGYAGPLGYASAAVMGDFIVVDMFAEVCSGNGTPKSAASRAADRAKRYYEI
jgi:multiple sugar transport system substrate-binding protein